MLIEIGKTLTAAFQLAGRILSIARKIPIIDDTIERVRFTLLNPILTRLIRHADDPDLDVCLDLYRKRIPDDQRFDPSDIVRWIREDERSRAAKGPSDWFVIAKYRKQVRGFVLFHYYPVTQLALFAYMVVANTPGVNFNSISRSLTHAIARFLKRRRELRGYRGLVMEVEDPRKEKTTRKRDEALARISRFCTLAEMNGLSLRVLDFDYKQPKLSLEEPDGSERPMLLLSARTRQADSVGGSYRSEVEELLVFIYMNVYPEGYSADAEQNRAYRRYCEELLDREKKTLPGQIRSLSSAQLAALVGKKKHTKRAESNC